MGQQADIEQAVLPDLAFDYQTIAEQIRQYRKAKKLTVPDVAHFTTAITEMTLEDTIEGSSTLTISVVDREWELIEFISVDKKGHLDPIDLNYPLDSQQWWRLYQLEMSGGVDGEQFSLTFIERPVAWLMHKHGPKKASRGKMTRAQFFQMLVKDVKAGRGLNFVSRELTKKQPVEGSRKHTPKSDSTRTATKGKGIPLDADLKSGGGKASKDQIKQMNRVLDVATDMNTSDRVVVALVCACIGESNFRVVKNPRSVYSGVLQADPKNIPMEDTEEQTRCFIEGGKGYHPDPQIGPPVVPKPSTYRGGAVYWAAQHKDWSPGRICWHVLGDRSNFRSDKAADDHYDSHRGEADAIIEAYGGGFKGGDTYYRKQFNFQIGTEDEPHQSYWDGMTQLAQDVNWRLFCDGRTIFFDSDMTLIRQEPAWIVRRDDPAIISYDATWDERKVCTEMTMTIICDPFRYKAGMVFQLQDFGPLSDGSTATEPLPGRWLITGITRRSGDLTSTFTLAQPEKPLREKAAETGTRKELDDENAGKGTGDLTSDMTPKQVIDDLVLPIGRKHGANACSGKLTPENVTTCNNNHGPTVSGGRSDHQGPPNIAWAADMGFAGAIDSPKGDALADELALAFDMKGGVKKNHVYDFGVADANHKGFRFQLGWRVEGHHDHVHFGVRRIYTSSPNRPDTAGNPDVSS